MGAASSPCCSCGAEDTASVVSTAIQAVPHGHPGRASGPQPTGQLTLTHARPTATPPGDLPKTLGMDSDAAWPAKDEGNLAEGRQVTLGEVRAADNDP